MQRPSAVSLAPLQVASSSLSSSARSHQQFGTAASAASPLPLTPEARDLYRMVVVGQNRMPGFYFKNVVTEEMFFQRCIIYRLCFHAKSFIYKLIDMLRKRAPTASHLIDDHTNHKENIFLGNALPCIATSMGVTFDEDSGRVLELAPEMRPMRLLEHLEQVVLGGAGTHKFRFLLLYAIYREKTLQTLVNELAEPQRLPYFYDLLAKMWLPGSSNHTLLSQINNDNAFTAIRQAVVNFCFLITVRPRLMALQRNPQPHQHQHQQNAEDANVLQFKGPTVVMQQQQPQPPQNPFAAQHQQRLPPPSALMPPPSSQGTRRTVPPAAAAADPSPPPILPPIMAYSSDGMALPFTSDSDPPAKRLRVT
jgi:hypothetical protein